MNSIIEYINENKTIAEDNFGISVSDLIKKEKEVRHNWNGSTLKIDIKYDLSWSKLIPLDDVVDTDGNKKKNVNEYTYTIPKVRKELEHLYGYAIENMISVESFQSKLDGIATINGKTFDLEIKSSTNDINQKTGTTPNHGKLKTSKTQLEALKDGGLLLYVYYKIDDASLDAEILNVYLRTPDLIECSNETAKFPSITKLRMDIYDKVNNKKKK